MLKNCVPVIKNHCNAIQESLANVR